MEVGLPIEVCYVILFVPSTIIFVLALCLTKGPWHKAAVAFFWIHVIAGAINSFFYTTGSFDHIKSLDKAPVAWKYSLFVLFGTNCFTLIAFFYLIFLKCKKLMQKNEEEKK